MNKNDYWEECIAVSFEDCGITATKEQIAWVAGDVQSSHENCGQAFYSPPAGEHLRSEIDSLKLELSRERNKVHCKECSGKGSITNHGPYHSATSQCHKCRGEGRHTP